jgi:hypothetical protein
MVSYTQDQIENVIRDSISVAASVSKDILDFHLRPKVACGKNMPYSSMEGEYGLPVYAMVSRATRLLIETCGAHNIGGR